MSNNNLKITERDKGHTENSRRNIKKRNKSNKNVEVKENINENNIM